MIIDTNLQFPVYGTWASQQAAFADEGMLCFKCFDRALFECLGDQLWPFWVATTTTTTVRAQDNSQSHCGITEFQTFKLGNVTMCLVTLTLAFGAPLHPRLEIVSLRHFVF